MGNNEKINIKKSISNGFKSLDLFGSTIGFQIRGNEAYNTIPGALISLIIYVIVLIYGTNKFFKMYNNLDTNFMQETKAGHIEMNRNFTFGEMEFNIAFGL